MNKRENTVENFLSLLSFMRGRIFRPAELITRNHLSPLQMHAISILHKEGNVTMTELAERLKISKQQLTSIVNKLIDSGMVVRKADEQDRRLVRLEITDTGRGSFHALHAELKRNFAEKLSQLSDAELDELGQLLTRILEILKKI